MDIAELIQPGVSGLNPAIWGMVGLLSMVAVGVVIALLRVAARTSSLAAENQDLRHTVHELREHMDVVGERLEYNQQFQRAHLGQIADFLEFQRPLDFAALRSPDAALPDSFLPDVDLHQPDDYNGEPLINTDPSRVVAVRPEPDLMSQLRPMAGEIGDVADGVDLQDDQVANESFAPALRNSHKR